MISQLPRNLFIELWNKIADDSKNQSMTQKLKVLEHKYLEHINKLLQDADLYIKVSEN